MKKQKKQSLLNTLIIILVIALIVMVGSIVYEEKINMSKQPTQNTAGQLDNEDDGEENETKDEENLSEDENKEENDDATAEEPDTEEPSTESEDEYVGEEEKNTEDSAQSEEEKVIALVKKQWGNDDSVTFNIENKSGSKYRVSVTSQATVLQWYEVDTETWEVSEF